MKKLSKFFITFTLVATLFLCPLTSFAYSGNLENSMPIIFHNEPQLNIKSYTPSEVRLYLGTAELVTNQNAYLASNGQLSNVQGVMFQKTDSQIDFDFVPEMYDYYFLMTVMGIADDPVNMSFTPSRIGFYDTQCDDTHTGHYVYDFSLYHHDDYDTIGFTVFGKLPSDFHNTNIHTIQFFNSKQNLTVAPSLKFEGLFIAVNKNSDTSALLPILNSIASNTASTTEKLVQINNVLNMYGSSNFTDYDKSEDKETIGDLNEAEKELIGDTSDHEQRLDITINPTATKVVWDSVDAFVQGNGKVFAMFITLLSLGFIKLVLNR